MRSGPDVFKQLPTLNVEAPSHDHALDEHPILKQLEQGEQDWSAYKTWGQQASKNFTTVLDFYRRRHGRNPPPGFDKWYKFAKKRKVDNLGDYRAETSRLMGPFEQIYDDLRPFWGVEPQVIRSLAARMHERKTDGVVGVHIRNGAVWKVNEGPTEWRADTFVKMIEPFVKDLPDMDIAINQLSKPRVTVPWDDLQALLSTEEKGRAQHDFHTVNEWTKDMAGFWTDETPKETIEDPQWSDISGQPYMHSASAACPPDSKARSDNMTLYMAEHASSQSRKLSIIGNHNRSIDLCHVGPHIASLHSMLHSPSNLLNTARLVPVFSDGKTNVNNDILYPSMLYWDGSTDGDADYAYSDTYDYAWDDKNDIIYWRGTTTGALKDAAAWPNMQRERLVRTLNGTAMAGTNVSVLSTDPMHPGAYTQLLGFSPARFAQEHADVAFVRGGPATCGRNCSALESTWGFRNRSSLAKQFRAKYVVDVDAEGAVSGRFRALLMSKSVPVKSTVFREWHTSRVFEWVHFVPMDVEYREAYSLLSYFVGYGGARVRVGGVKAKPEGGGMGGGEGGENEGVYVARHDVEGRGVGANGAEWARQVLRREDMEVYMFRLLLEYGRIIDDNRDYVGYVGDGSEVDDSKWGLELLGFGN